MSLYFRNSLLFCMFLLAGRGFSTFAQGITIGTGATVQIVEAAALSIKNADFINDGTFISDKETVTFLGSSQDSISGSSATTFYQLLADSCTALILVADSLSIDSQLLAKNQSNMYLAGNSQVFIDGQSALMTDTTSTLNTSLESARFVLNPGAVYYNQGPVLNAKTVASSLSATNRPLLEVRQQLSGTAPGWRMLATPVDTSLAGIFKQPAITTGFPGSSFPNEACNLFFWNEAIGNSYFESYEMPTSLNQIPQPGNGFFYFNYDGAEVGSNTYSDSLPLQLSATGWEPQFNSGNFNFNLSFTPKSIPNAELGDSIYYDSQIEAGWNLIGNPTASFINWSSSNGWVKTNLDNTIYVWDPSANNNQGEYRYWSADSAVSTLSSPIIAPFQGFWVRANAVNPSLQMKRQAITSTPGNFYKSAGEEVAATHISIKAQAKELESKAFVTISADGITGEDAADIYRLEPLSDTYLACYTNSSLLHNAPLINNHLPESEPNNYIPLYLELMEKNISKNATFSISWEIPADWPSNRKIELMDHINHTAINMLMQEEYSIDVPAHKESWFKTVKPATLPTKNIQLKNTDLKSNLKNTHPMAIVISDGNAWDQAVYTSPTATLNNPFPNPFYNQTTIGFQLPLDGFVQIQIVDLYGKILDIPVSDNFEAGYHEINYTPDNEYNGMCIVRLVSENGNDSKKIIRLNN